MFTGEYFDPFTFVKLFLEVRQDKVVADNWIYFMHRKWSVLWTAIALFFAVAQPIVLQRPLDCISSEDEDITEEFWHEYCWIHGTHIILEHINGKIGVDVPHPGIGFEYGRLRNGSRVEYTKIYQMHYIFYPIIILAQYCLFSAASGLWHTLEGKKLKHLISELTTSIVDGEMLQKRTDQLTTYMSSSITFHDSYARKYIMCEFFNCFNVIFQFCLIDYFLNQNFFNFGIDVVRYMRAVSDESVKQQNLVDPLVKTFPKVTLCTLVAVGPGGNGVPHETLCVMPLNNMAEKIFFFMWFWLVILGTFTLLGMVYRLLMLASPYSRYLVLLYKAKMCKSNQLKYFVKNSSYGDWFVLSLMINNMDPWVFSHVFNEIIDKKKSVKEKDL